MTSLMRLPSIFNFADEFESALRGQEQTHTPPIEIVKDDKEYRVIAHLPGVKRENLGVKVENGTLTISGKYEKTDRKEDSVVRSEIVSYAEFKRTLRVDQSAFDLDKIEANLKDGVLDLRLPVREAVQPRQIEVKVN